MAKLIDRLKTQRFALGVKQHTLVLEFTTALQDTMNALDITQSELAKRLRKSRSWVSKIFCRAPNLTFFTAVEVANALDMDVEIRAVRRGQAPVALPSNVIPIGRLPNAASYPVASSNQPPTTTSAPANLEVQAA